MNRKEVYDLFESLILTSGVRTAFEQISLDWSVELDLVPISISILI
jgi:hypothetical protein